MIRVTGIRSHSFPGDYEKVSQIAIHVGRLHIFPTFERSIPPTRYATRMIHDFDIDRAERAGGVRVGFAIRRICVWLSVSICDET